MGDHVIEASDRGEIHMQLSQERLCFRGEIARIMALLDVAGAATPVQATAVQCSHGRGRQTLSSLAPWSW